MFDGSTNYIIHLCIITLINCMYALTLNLTVGYTGMLVVCQSAFSAIAAYTVAILSLRYGVNFFFAVPVAMLFGALAGSVLGFVLVRVRGDYFALGTIGFTYITVSILNNWQSFTRGPFGISGIPRPKIGSFVISEPLYFLVLAAIACALVYAACVYITSSNFGRALKAIRDDETALQVFGFKTTNYKLLIFAISGALVAVGGSLHATYISYIDPSSFKLDYSILGLSFIILGGLASNKGAVLGAVILTIFPELLRLVGFPDSLASQMRIFIYGVLLVVLMLYRPQGLVGEYKL